MSLGRVLRDLRKETGLTRAALAQAAGLDPGALSRIESGDRPNLRFSTVCRLAAALGVSIDDIAARAGLTAAKGILQGKPIAQGAAVLHGVQSAEASLDQAQRTLADVKKRLLPAGTHSKK